MTTSRPNVLFLFSDQHRADALGCAGHPVVQTPNLDRLAASGVRFERTYAAAPICGPCRSALITGRHVHRCGALTHGHMKRDMGLPTMGAIFRNAGYATGAFGKVHVAGESDDNDIGFDERALEIYTPMKSDYQHAIGLEKFWQYCSYLPQYKPHPDAQVRHGYNLKNEPIQLEEEFILDTMTADHAIDFMQRVSGFRVQSSGGGIRDRVRDRDAETENAPQSSIGNRQSAIPQPFFLWVGLEKPHNEMYAPKRFHDLYDPGKMQLPENRRFDRSRLPGAIYDNPSFPIADGLTDDQMRHAMAAYFANVSYMDEQAGRVLDALDELGLSENTIVFYSTDHGEHLFNHQMVHKMCFFEEAARVPLILRIPGVTKAGTTRNQFASLLDLLPTFCDACGIVPPTGIDGKSLLPVIRDNAPLREAVFSEYYDSGVAERMIRTERWKYVHSEGDRHQLYDLEHDPHENVNLIDDPAFADVCAELDARLRGDWVMPDLSGVPKRRGDTRPGQRGCKEKL
jgi:arylsulfatase A-like enzyme